MKDTMIDFVLEFLKNHDPAFKADYERQFPTTGNNYYNLLDWENWIFS